MPVPAERSITRRFPPPLVLVVPPVLLAIAGLSYRQYPPHRDELLDGSARLATEQRVAVNAALAGQTIPPSPLTIVRSIPAADAKAL